MIDLLDAIWAREMDSHVIVRGDSEDYGGYSR